jgi:hypothetical protein
MDKTTVETVDLPLPRNQGYSYIFGMIDVHSKMFYAAPLKTKMIFETAHSGQNRNNAKQGVG